jgi:hypothetical protein
VTEKNKCTDVALCKEMNYDRKVGGPAFAGNFSRTPTKQKGQVRPMR